MTATLFIRVTASIQGCLKLLLSWLFSFQRSVDLCSLYGKEREGRRKEGGREGERKKGRREGIKKEQTTEITGLVKYDGSDVLTFLQIWMLLFFFLTESTIFAASSLFVGTIQRVRCKDMETDVDKVLAVALHPVHL